MNIVMDNKSHAEEFFGLINNTSLELSLVSSNEILEIRGPQTEILRLKDKMDSLSLFDSEVINNTELRVSKDRLTYLFYWSSDEFLSSFTGKDFLDIAILDIERRELNFFDADQEKTFRNSLEVTDYEITNAIHHNKLIDLLKAYSVEINGFHLVDLYKSVNREFLLISENGRKVTIKHNLQIPLFSYNIKPHYNLIEEVLSSGKSKDLPIFFKSAIVELLGSKSKTVQIETLIEYINEIHNLALLNYNIYLNNISIDNLKSDYRVYKEKYLDKFTDILNKLSTQVIALPISFSALIFVVYRLKDEKFALGFIVFLLLVLLIYADMIIQLYRKEIKNLKSVITDDFDLILKKDLFLNFDNEKKYFETIKRRLEEKSDSLISLLSFYLPIVYLFTFGIIGYSIFLFSKDIDSTIILSIFFCLVATIRYAVGLAKRENQN